MGTISAHLPPVSSGYFSGMGPGGGFAAKDQVAHDGGETAVEGAGTSAAFPAEAGARQPGRGAGKAALAREGERTLSREEIRVLEELKQQDRQVRAHEQAHAAIGGLYASAPTYTYRRGPDGAFYAVGGEVAIDTSPVRGNPEATLRKAQQVRAAALAPADPSPQDRNVAAQASQMEARAQSELAQEPAREGKQEGSGQPPGAAEEEKDGGRRVVLRALAQYQFFVREEFPVNPRQPATEAAASGVSAPRAPRVVDLIV